MTEKTRKEEHKSLLRHVIAIMGVASNAIFIYIAFSIVGISTLLATDAGPIEFNLLSQIILSLYLVAGFFQVFYIGFGVVFSWNTALNLYGVDPKAKNRGVGTDLGADGAGAGLGGAQNEWREPDYGSSSIGAALSALSGVLSIIALLAGTLLFIVAIWV